MDIIRLLINKFLGARRVAFLTLVFTACFVELSGGKLSEAFISLVSMAAGFYWGKSTTEGDNEKTTINPSNN